MNEIEKIKALANQVRMEILIILRAQKAPVTIKAVAERISTDPVKLHYHFKVLEKAGLIRIADTKEINGIVEKYYASSLESDIEINLRTLSEETKAVIPLFKKNTVKIIDRLLSLKNEDIPAFGAHKIYNLSKEEAVLFKQTFLKFLKGEQALLPEISKSGDVEYDVIVAFVPRAK